MTIQEGLREFYQINHFEEDGGESKSWAWIKFGFFSLPIPNPESRKQVLFLHDIHHLITENDTDWRGEASVSGWEVATGGWGMRLYIWWIILGAFMIGVFRYPRTTFHAFVKGCRTQSVVGLGMPKNELLKLSVDDLRQQLGFYRITDTKPNITEIASYVGWALLTVFIYIVPLVGLILLVL